MSKEKLGIQYKCQKCGKRKLTIHRREIYTEKYEGPCGGSFCYASCDSSSCRPVYMTVCNECAVKMSKKETK
jgi:hypothetical protein